MPNYWNGHPVGAEPDYYTKETMRAILQIELHLKRIADALEKLNKKEKENDRRSEDE